MVSMWQQVKYIVFQKLERVVVAVTLREFTYDSMQNHMES